MAAFENKGNKERTRGKDDEHGRGDTSLKANRRYIRNLTLNPRCVEDSLIKTTRGDGRSEIRETKIINESNECSRNTNTGGRIH